jgi:hypothetical protein
LGKEPSGESKGGDGKQQARRTELHRNARVSETNDKTFVIASDRKGSGRVERLLAMTEGDTMIKPSLLFLLAAIYLAIGGLVTLIVPVESSFGMIPAASSGALVAFIRGYGGSLIGIAVLDFLVRNEGSSKARDAIFLGNFVGFGLVALTDILALAAGAPQAALVFTVLDILFALGFLFVGKSNMSTS